MQIHIPIYYKKYFPDDTKKCYDLARQMQVISMRNGTLTWKDENKSIVLQEDGEAIVLDKIREQKMEPRLAACCVVAQSSDRNQNRQVPIKVSQSITDLALSYSASESKPAVAKKNSKGKSSSPAIDLDLDEN